MKSDRSKTKILVVSLDFDGCLFHNKGTVPSENPLFDHNEEFFNKLEKQIADEDYTDVVFIVGSNRQSHAADERNARNPARQLLQFEQNQVRMPGGSCFVAINKICQRFKENHKDSKIKFSVDPYLLSDSYGKTDIGHNFTQAICGKAVSEWYWDETKLTILYAQMHKLASENPDAEVTFNFYDDRYHPPKPEGDGEKLLDPDDIVHALIMFFAFNRDLVPKNVTLCMHHYNGDKLSKRSNIVGKGEPDANYHDNIELMIKCAGLDYDNHSPKDRESRNHHILEHLCKGDNLKKFKDQRVLTATQPKNNAEHSKRAERLFSADDQDQGAKKENGNKISNFKNSAK